MAPPKAALVKWTQEEVDVLVAMTNAQLELEAQDESMLISWTTHWKKVSQRLKELGYVRTPTACRGIWCRGVQEQRAQRDAAGDDWDESEHEILVHMTKKQLDLEKVSQANVIPWAKHWTKVSMQLDENNYSRTAEQCAAYWSLVESDVVGDAAALGEDEDALDAADDDDFDDVEEEEDQEDDDFEASPEKEPVAEKKAESEQEPEPEPAEPQATPETEDEDTEMTKAPDPVVTSPQSSKSSIWGSDEYENLLRLLKGRRKAEAAEGLEMLTGSKLWVHVAEQHRSAGYDRSFEGCKTFWNKQGRERSAFDERVKPSPILSTRSMAQPMTEPSTASPKSPRITRPPSEQSKPSSVSGGWATVNEREEPAVAVMNPAIEALKRFQSIQSIEMNVSPEPFQAKSPDSYYLESDLSQEQVQAQKDRAASLNSSTPTHSGVSDKGASSSKYGLTSFRFTPEQRAVLEAEASRTGGTLDSHRKTELAIDLGVEEKTVRNWFNNYNVKARRTQGTTPTGLVQTPPYDEFHNLQPAGTPTPSPQVFANLVSGIPKRPYFEEGGPDQPHPAKRMHSEPEVETFHVTGGFNPVNGHSSRHSSSDNSAPPRTKLPDARHSSLRAEHPRPDNDVPLQGPPHCPPRVPLPSSAPSIPLEHPPAGTFVKQDGVFYVTMGPKSRPEVPAPPAHLQLKSTPQSQLQPQPDPVIQQGPPPRHHHQPILAPHPPSANYPSILQENRNGPPNMAQPPPHVVNGGYGEPPRERKTPEPELPPRGPSQASPAQQWARQPLPNIQPQPQQQQHRPPPPLQVFAPSPAPYQDPNVRPRTASTPSDENPIAQAQRHIDSFRSEIQTLNAVTSARTGRVTALSQELSVFAARRADVGAARDAAVAQALRDIDAHYGAIANGLREQEERLEREKGLEVEGLNKVTQEMQRKQKGLQRWQGLLEYYEENGDAP